LLWLNLSCLVRFVLVFLFVLVHRGSYWFVNLSLHGSFGSVRFDLDSLSSICLIVRCVKIVLTNWFVCLVGQVLTLWLFGESSAHTLVVRWVECSQFGFFSSFDYSIWMFGESSSHIWLFGESSAHNLVSSLPFGSSDCIALLPLLISLIALHFSLLLILLIDCTSPPIDSSDWLHCTSPLLPYWFFWLIALHFSPYWFFWLIALHFSPFWFFWLITLLALWILLNDSIELLSIGFSVWLLLSTGSFVSMVLYLTGWW